jgi:hypothetical protein
MRTYSRSDWQAANLEWDEGDFSHRWQGIRRIAAERGFIYPPAGSAHDDRDAESPSQRAIVWRALEDNPAELERIVRRSRSWSQVVDGIIGMETRKRLDADDADALRRWEDGEEPDHREAVQTIAAILDRIDQSR